MRRGLALSGLIAAPVALAAQTVPSLDDANPRLQSVQYEPGERILLTALPESGLTVMLEPGEQIDQVVPGAQFGYQIRVSAERDSFVVLPDASASPTTLTVQTDKRGYQFDLRTGNGLLAAYLVQLEYGAPATPVIEEIAPAPGPVGPLWTYRVKGDRSVRPARIVDDGARTWITFGNDQALPAVFTVGPNGKEQVVNGYMRGTDYVIDRVHAELVFRIDKEKATARRAKTSEDRR